MSQKQFKVQIIMLKIKTYKVWLKPTVNIKTNIFTIFLKDRMRETNNILINIQIDQTKSWTLNHKIIRSWQARKNKRVNRKINCRLLKLNHNINLKTESQIIKINQNNRVSLKRNQAQSKKWVSKREIYIRIEMNNNK